MATNHYLVRRDVFTGVPWVGTNKAEVDAFLATQPDASRISTVVGAGNVLEIHMQDDPFGPYLVNLNEVVCGVGGGRPRAGLETAPQGKEITLGSNLAVNSVKYISVEFDEVFESVPHVEVGTDNARLTLATSEIDIDGFSLIVANWSSGTCPSTAKLRWRATST